MLALTVAAVVSLRVLPPALGACGVALGVAGTAATVLVAVAAARRGARVASVLPATGVLPPGGALLTAVAVLVSLGAAAGFAAVITIAAHHP